MFSTHDIHNQPTSNSYKCSFSLSTLIQCFSQENWSTVAYHNTKASSSEESMGLQEFVICKRIKKEKPIQHGGHSQMRKHRREPDGWPCLSLLAFEGVQTQMMDFETQTVKCHILQQQGFALQINIMTQDGMGWWCLEENTISTVDLLLCVTQ